MWIPARRGAMQNSRPEVYRYFPLSSGQENSAALKVAPAAQPPLALATKDSTHVNQLQDERRENSTPQPRWRYRKPGCVTKFSFVQPTLFFLEFSFRAPGSRRKADGFWLK